MQNSLPRLAYFFSHNPSSIIFPSLLSEESGTWLDYILCAMTVDDWERLDLATGVLSSYS